MTKLTTAGIAALFAALSIAASTVPAAAGHHGHGHHGHHGHGHWGGGYGFGFGFPTIIVNDDPDPVYCVDRRGRLYVCAYN
jgi:hypothetical protein